MIEQNEQELTAEQQLAAKKAADKAAKAAAKAAEQGAKTEANLEAEIRKQEKSLRQQLDEMPKVTIEIPIDENNPDDVAVVGWNGIIYSIPRGIEFEVPVVIRDIWKESHEKTKAVNKRIRESINKEIVIM
ncbi:hypothetical protein [Cohnella sp. AR92]|uniref:hypothetical protein n=1 Tax=Cohnella sp. AR92 TaxID=648716 RepID=UPI000F8DB9BB|nr:hypothetical protein [Cohnella sp. AR92]RUS42273.1 hypothetical protein ELR57_27050 [Cohnella sp. AR92]